MYTKIMIPIDLKHIEQMGKAVSAVPVPLISTVPLR
jgi:hypothetical protein